MPYKTTTLKPRDPPQTKKSDPTAATRRAMESSFLYVNSERFKSDYLEGDGFMTFTMPMPPTMSTNKIAAWHWSTIAEIHGQYTEYCKSLFSCGLMPSVPPSPWPRAVLQARLYVKGGVMDKNGLVERLKWPVDLIVKAGYIVDDNPECLDWEWPTQERVTTPGYIVLTLLRSPDAVAGLVEGEGK